MRPPRLLAVRGLLLTAFFGVTLATSGHCADDNMASNVTKLADALVKKDDQAAALAKAIAKKADREEVMNLFTIPSQGGLGVGPAKDGIELKIIALGEKGISKDELTKQSADLKRMAEITVAIAHVSEHYAAKAGTPKKTELWKKHNADFQTQSVEFLDAINKNDPDAVKKSATKLYSVCIACHKDIK